MEHNILGIYMSGNGHTQHGVEKIVQLLDEKAKVFSIEETDLSKQIRDASFVVVGYPVQFSNLPLMMRDFIEQQAISWQGKKVLCVATMAFFSGDGAGCSARLLKQYGAQIVGGIHIRMPEVISDRKLLRRSLEENRQIVALADQKIESVVQQIKKGKYPQEGLKFRHRLLGFLGQRLWFYEKTRHYSDQIRVGKTCNGCGVCVRLCPMENLRFVEGKVIAEGRCAMCYRCVNRCPQRAITLLGEKVYEPVYFRRYTNMKDE